MAALTGTGAAVQIAVQITDVTTAGQSLLPLLPGCLLPVLRGLPTVFGTLLPALLRLAVDVAVLVRVDIVWPCASLGATARRVGPGVAPGRG